MAALEDLLDPSYPGPLAERSIEDLRSLRAECQEVETGLSLLRRLVQGHLDLVEAEVRRRADGAEPGDLASLVEQLPEVLSDRTVSPGVGRLPQLLAPEAVDPVLEAELAHLVGPATMTELPELDDASLGSLAEALQGFEQRVSSHRRSLFDRIDGLQDEITARYRSGAASVDSLFD